MSGMINCWVDHVRRRLVCNNLELYDFFIIANFMHPQVMERNGAVIGCAALQAFESDHTAEVYAFAIHPTFRGQGRGDRLLESLELAARQRIPGIRNMFLLTTRTMDWFYQRGYTPVGPAHLRSDHCISFLQHWRFPEVFTVYDQFAKHFDIATLCILTNYDPVGSLMTMTPILHNTCGSSQQSLSKCGTLHYLCSQLWVLFKQLHNIVYTSSSFPERLTTCYMHSCMSSFRAQIFFPSSTFSLPTSRSFLVEVTRTQPKRNI